MPCSAIGPFRERLIFMCPFAHRCGYCNFTLIAGRDDLFESFLQAIGRELAAIGGPFELDTLFLGGGTPTHLPADLLRRLFATLRKTFLLAPGYELSVEANPLDLTPERVAVLCDEGVNRLSLGVQSFDDDKLRMLERDHRRGQALRACELAKDTFASSSLDLIFGTPGETPDGWQNDLQQAIGLGPSHVSTYGLTFEQGTSFWQRLQQGALARLDEESERGMYAAAIDTLSAAGYEHYEVSNFARPGFRCRHNETYWSGDGYFAAGPGGAVCRRPPRNQPSEHDDLSEARPGRRVAGGGERDAGAGRSSPGAIGVWFTEAGRRVARDIRARDGVFDRPLGGSAARAVCRRGFAGG